MIYVVLQEVDALTTVLDASVPAADLEAADNITYYNIV
jgi:hypothetical protein